METSSGQDIKSELLAFFSNLSYMSTVPERQTLVKYVGLEGIVSQIEWEGSPTTFSARLLDLLVRSGQQTLVHFLNALAQSSLVGGIEQKENLLALSTELASFTPIQWRIAFLQQIIERFKKATVQDMKLVGNKYISELYFPRLQIEENFGQFLSNDATCFLIVAKAGRGKTNLLCRIVEEFQDTRPVLFLSGRVDPKGDTGILTRIANRLGYENWLVCFEALGNFAENGPSPLILIDGINESAAKPQAMREALNELLVQANSRKIKICITCRTDFWQFYRGSFRGEYVWRSNESSGATRAVRGEDLPIFPEEDFDRIIEHYFNHFMVQGRLVSEAWERCRNPLLLRFFCEAYSHRIVGVVSQIRLYALLKLFWGRKIENIQSVVEEGKSVNRFILMIAQMMLQRHQTRVPKDDVARETGTDVIHSDSLYQRILDEEIILEEELDELSGTANVIFVYDKFSEYTIALHIFSSYLWIKKSREDIIADIIRFMGEEIQQEFATLRGALEFSVLRLEDYRKTEAIHFDVIKAMLEYDWKWRRIGSLLAFQLTYTDEQAFWDFMAALTQDKRDFVRRICAEQLNQLIIQHSNHVLPLLNRLLQDDNPSVRQAARASLFNLDAVATIQEVKLLTKEFSLEPTSLQLTAELLLSPRDSDSLVLLEKLLWLVKEVDNGDIQNAIINYMNHLNLPAYEDLYTLEELARIFQIINTSVNNPYLEVIHSNITRRKEELEADLERLDTLRLIMQFLYEFISDFLNIPTDNSEQVLLEQFHDLFPNTEIQRDFLEMLEKETQVSLPTSTFFFIIDIAFALAEATDAFKDETVSTYLSKLKISTSNSSLLQLCLVTNQVVREAIKIFRKSYSFANVNIDLKREGFHLEADKRGDFLEKVVSKFGIELSTREQRTLTSLGRLSLWIWQKKVLEHEQEEALQKKVEQITKLSIDQLKKHFSEFESVNLSKGTQQDLFLALRALCHIYASSEVIKVVDALTPFIIWSNENDSSELAQAFLTLYRRDSDSFWTVGKALLENEDQRVIDFASQILEQVEYAEELPPSPIADRLKKIIVDMLGLDESEVIPSASLVDDLNADSLDLVELIMSIEEEFKLQISDEDAETITTVQEALDYIEEHLQ